MCHKQNEMMVTSGSVVPNKNKYKLISPLRRVAKSAKVNLNKYWSRFNGSKSSLDSSAVASTGSFENSSSYVNEKLSLEQQDNRINEILEDRNAYFNNSMRAKYATSVQSAPAAMYYSTCRCCYENLYNSNQEYLSKSIESLDNTVSQWDSISQQSYNFL